MTEIKALPTVELVEKLGEERDLLLKMNFGHAVAPIENPMKIKTSRRLIARYLTELSFRKNNEQES